MPYEQILKTNNNNNNNNNNNTHSKSNEKKIVCDKLFIVGNHVKTMIYTIMQYALMDIAITSQVHICFWVVWKRTKVPTNALI